MHSLFVSILRFDETSHPAATGFWGAFLVSLETSTDRIHRRVKIDCRVTDLLHQSVENPVAA
jgi:hypothetical protein